MSPKLDPLQFAYKRGTGVDDAVIYLLHRSILHLEELIGSVRVMFFDFSSAFNTLQPLLLKGKLEGVGVDSQLTAWTIVCLTNRPQVLQHRCSTEDIDSWDLG